MRIICQSYYKEVVEYAKSKNDTTLQECLEHLERWERNPIRPSLIELYRDFAPYSFIFKQIYEDGTLGVIGGLVYHGDPDESYCYAEPRIRGWAIHT